jgi:hypothetical protein
MAQTVSSLHTEFASQSQYPPQAQITSRVPAYLYQKRKIYYFRYALPKTQRALLGQMEIRLSLKTGYIREATFRSSLLHGLLSTLLENETVLSINEIKTRLNHLLLQMTEARARNLEPIRIEIGPEPDMPPSE